MNLRYTSNAKRRLQKITDFNGKRGPKVANQILDRADKLKENPKLGPPEKNLEQIGQGHRSLLVGTLYKIVYLISKPIILITDIFDVRQDPDNMKP